MEVDPPGRRPSGHPKPPQKCRKPCHSQFCYICGVFHFWVYSRRFGRRPRSRRRSRAGRVRTGGQDRSSKPRQSTTAAGEKRCWLFVFARTKRRKTKIKWDIDVWGAPQAFAASTTPHHHPRPPDNSRPFERFFLVPGPRDTRMIAGGFRVGALSRTVTASTLNSSLPASFFSSFYLPLPII